MIVVLVEHFFNAAGRDAFPTWIQSIGEAASRFPGFADIRQMTRLDDPERCFFLLAFETPDQLQTWVASGERSALLDQMAAFREKKEEGVRWLAGEHWAPSLSNA
jgi:antibiotic biosynthesis monooxygenase (ABM) superfamily enzyme